MTQPKIGIAIEAEDDTKAGVKSAERSLGGLVKRTGKAGAESASITKRGFAQWGKSVTQTFSRVEQAAGRVFGSGSALGGTGGGSIIGRLGAIRQMAALAGEGMGGAAAEAGALEAGLVGVGGAAAATGAVVVGLAAAMVKLADGWGKGANQLGNMASLIGVSTKGLQEFAGAAERVGVDKNTAMGAMGSLSQTLNDARYGRNQTAMTVLGRTGVEMKLNKDGTVNVEAMLPAIANALQRQNSSGRRTAARLLGIPDGALAAFTQGGKALSTDMADYGRHGAVVTDKDVALGRAITHRDTVASQWVAGQVNGVGRVNAGVVKGAGDAVIGGYGAITKRGGSTVNAGRAVGPARAAITPTGAGALSPGGGQGPAVPRWRSGGRMTSAEVRRRAQHAERAFLKYRAQGMSPDEAAAWAANGEAESSNDPHKQQPGGPGYGLFQWGSPVARLDRRRDFRRAMGKSIYGSSEADQDRFRAWELTHTETRAARAISRAAGAGGKAAAITASYERPQYGARDAADRANIAESIIRLEINFKNAPKGVTATAVGPGRRPAISHAHEPDH